MAYTLSKLLQEIFGDLGMSNTFKATGGSTSTVVDTKLGTLTNKPVQDIFRNYYMFVVRDAGGAGAAPEGEFQRVSAYASDTYTYTVDTVFSAAVAANDTLMTTTPDIAVPEAIERINRAITKETIALPDTSLTTVADQQQYSLPVAAKREPPLSVEIQTTAGDDESYAPRNDVQYIPSAAGSVGKIRFIKPITAGMTIRIIYKAYHPELTAYNSVVHETTPAGLILAVAKLAVLEWYSASNESNDYWMQMANIARGDVQELRQRVETYIPTRPPRLFRYT